MKGAAPPLANARKLAGAATLLALLGSAVPAESADTPGGPGQVLIGATAFGDWTRDAPELWRHIRPADLPPPHATRSAVNGARVVRRPAGALPKVPPGFKAELFASGLDAPRQMRLAPNGDVFLAETQAGTIKLLRAAGSGKPAAVATYVEGLEGPFGLAFYPPGPDPHSLYVGTAGAVLRFPYRTGDTAPRGKAETVVPNLPEGGHWTRDVVFSPDGRRMYVSVGSLSNDEDGPEEAGRANILAFNPDGTGGQRFATGLRNPVGLAIHPLTGDLWTVVNERDELGDNLPPDYATRVRDGAFYGWPWYYIGAHQDPRHAGAHPELRDRVTVPDVLIQPHSAPLGLAVYTGTQFPAAYQGDLFVALHGSWNRAYPTGYKLIRIALRQGQPTGKYEDFMTGFITLAGDVWGRPVGVVVAADGSLLMSEDAGGTVWRIIYTGP